MHRLLNPNGTFSPSLFEVPFSKLTPEENFQLVGIKPFFGTDANGRPNTEILGYGYSLFVPDLFGSVNVKVANPKPIILPNVFEKTDDDIFVRVSPNTVLRPYRIEFGQAYATIRSDSIDLLN